MLTVPESSSGVGAGGLPPAPLSCSLPCPRALQEPRSPALARVPPQGAGGRPLPSARLSPRPALAWPLAAAMAAAAPGSVGKPAATGWNRLQAAPGCPAASSILSRSVPSARALCLSPLKAFASLACLSSCALGRTEAFPLGFHSPPPAQHARAGKRFPEVLSWNPSEIPVPLGSAGSRSGNGWCWPLFGCAKMPAECSWD